MSERTAYRRRRAAGLTHPRVPLPVDELFLTTWSDDFAWVLGYIWSDGCLHRNTIEICSIDSQPLEYVAAFIGQPDSIAIKNGGSALRVTFTSRPVAEFLRSLGLTPAKSLTAVWPAVPEPYEGHFLRGLLDGDGSVSFRQDRPGQQAPDLRVDWCGAAPILLDGLLDCLARHHVDARYRWIENGHAGLWRVTVLRQASLRVLFHLMYPHPDVPTLSRKAVPYAVWMETPRLRPGRPSRAVIAL